MTRFTRTIAIAFVVFASFSGCKKDKDVESKEYDTQTSQDNSLAEFAFADVNNIVNQALHNGSGGLVTYRLASGIAGTLSNCATVSLTPDSSGTGGTLTVDFGSVNCQCSDMRYRRGKIMVAYTGSYMDSGTVITTTFDNYHIGRDTASMYLLTGTKTVANKGRNGFGHIYFEVNVNGALTNHHGHQLTWTASRQREWIAGESTTGNGLIDWLDDEYYITGTSAGTSFEGTSFMTTITQPLHVALNCAWIKDGIFELTPIGKPTRSLDYGNGSCDNQATITVNGASFDITLR